MTKTRFEAATEAIEGLMRELNEWKTAYESLNQAANEETEKLQKEVARFKEVQTTPSLQTVMDFMIGTCIEYGAAKGKYEKALEYGTRCFHCNELFAQGTPREVIAAHTAECPEHPAVKKLAEASAIIEKYDVIVDEHARAMELLSTLQVRVTTQGHTKPRYVADPIPDAWIQQFGQLINTHPPKPVKETS